MSKNDSQEWYKKLQVLDYVNAFGKSVLFGHDAETSDYYVWETDFNVFDPVPNGDKDIYKSQDREDAYSYFNERIGDYQNTVQYKSPEKNGVFYNKSQAEDIDYNFVDKKEQAGHEYKLFKSMQDSFAANAKRYDYGTFGDTTYCVGSVNTPNYEEWRVWFTKSSANETNEADVKYLAESLNKENAVKVFKSIVETEKKRMYRRFIDDRIEYLEKNY